MLGTILDALVLCGSYLDGCAETTMEASWLDPPVNPTSLSNAVIRGNPRKRRPCRAPAVPRLLPIRRSADSTAALAALAAACAADAAPPAWGPARALASAWAAAPRGGAAWVSQLACPTIPRRAVGRSGVEWQRPNARYSASSVSVTPRASAPPRRAPTPCSSVGPTRWGILAARPPSGSRSGICSRPSVSAAAPPG